jgi:hypothetical protein
MAGIFVFCSEGESMISTERRKTKTDRREDCVISTRAWRELATPNPVRTKTQSPPMAGFLFLHFLLLPHPKQFCNLVGTFFAFFHKDLNAETEKWYHENTTTIIYKLCSETSSVSFFNCISLII